MQRCSKTHTYTRTFHQTRSDLEKGVFDKILVGKGDICVYIKDSGLAHEIGCGISAQERKERKGKKKEGIRLDWNWKQLLIVLWTLKLAGSSLAELLGEIFVFGIISKQ